MLRKNLKNRLKKTTVWLLVFGYFFNMLGVTYADDSEKAIEDYCEEQLGEEWDSFNYTPDSTEYTDQSYSEIKDTYHTEINELFNQAVQTMLDEVGGETDLKQVCTDKKISKKMENAITTYEISRKALCRYASYQAVLNAKMNYIVTEDLNDTALEDFMPGKSDLQINTYQALVLMREEMQNELEFAKMSLNKTLAIYDEMLVMYPLHLRLRCIIADLLTFRTHLAKLVNIFFCLERYINAASDKLD